MSIRRSYMAFVVVFMPFFCSVVVAQEDFVEDPTVTSELLEICGELGEILTPRISNVPTVVRANARWMQRRAKSLGSPHEKLLCFFDTAANQILIRAGEQLGSNEAMTASDIPLLRRITLSHELAHAWQQEWVLAKLPKAQQTDRMVLHAVLEGHAQWVAGRYAERMGAGRHVARIRRQQERSVPIRPDEIESHFIYQDGLKFWEYRLALDSKVGLSAILTDRRVTQRSIAYPGALPTDLEIPSVRAETLVGAGHNAAWKPTDYIEFRKLVAGLSLIPRQFDVCRAYEGSWRSGSEERSVALVRFSSDRAARVLFDALSTRESIESDEVVKSVAPVLYSAHVSRPSSPRRVNTLFLLAERNVIEVCQRGAETLEVKGWAEEIAQRFSKEMQETKPGGGR